MKRRNFARLAALSAVAVSTTGFIRFNGKSYQGDCETTTDILGPFYRPGSPERTNLVVAGTQGEIVELSGTVRHNDCVTPYRGAKVELWHCSADEVYDNDSGEYRYRGTTYCDDDGYYHFITQMPVPYDDGGGNYRPAHFHLMISGPGHQSFITQIYFQGDPFLNKDPFAASPLARARVLQVKSSNGKKIVAFDVNLNERLSASYDALARITGAYRDDQSGSTVEFFGEGNELWQKSKPYGFPYRYIGSNQFEYPGMPPGRSRILTFKIQPDGSVRATMSSESGNKKSERFYTKI